MTAKDLFSAQSVSYANHRPTYPEGLFDLLAAEAGECKLAWDVACGTGQATKPLSTRFHRVVGTDISQNQLDQVPAIENASFHVCSAEQPAEEITAATGLEAGTVDLITVAQAIHWFNYEAFYANAKRFLRPDGVIAVWTYTWPTFTGNSELTTLFKRFADTALKAYWAPERAIVDGQYADVPFPFQQIVNATKEPWGVMQYDWTFEDMLGYMRSWSAYQTALKTGTDPLNASKNKLRTAWGPATSHQAVFSIFLLLGRK